MGTLRWKSAGLPLAADAEGVVEALPAITNIVDSVGDIIQPGAFVDSLRRRNPKVVASHNFDAPVALVTAAEEWMPGDPRLPIDLKSAGAGALFVRARFNLTTQRGQEAFSDLQHFGDEAGWSIGYAVAEQSFDVASGANLLHKIDLYECSPVLFGAMAEARSLALKDARRAARQQNPYLLARLAAAGLDDLIDDVREGWGDSRPAA